jgi:hypothetical protein
MIFTYNEFNEIKLSIKKFENIEKMYATVNEKFNELIRDNYLNKFSN